MVSRRDKSKADTRVTLLRAARALFAEQGFEATTLAAVARRAGVAVGTVYVHFPDKPTLLTEALHADLERVIDGALAALPASGARARLLHMAEALYRYYAADPALSRVLVKESIFAPLVPGQRPDAVLGRFIGAVERALAEGGALRAGVSPEQGAAAFFGLYLVALIGGLRGEVFDVDAQVGVLDGLLGAMLNEADSAALQEVARG